MSTLTLTRRGSSNDSMRSRLGITIWRVPRVTLVANLPACGLVHPQIPHSPWTMTSACAPPIWMRLWGHSSVMVMSTARRPRWALFRVPLLRNVTPGCRLCAFVQPASYTPPFLSLFRPNCAVSRRCPCFLDITYSFSDNLFLLTVHFLLSLFPVGFSCGGV